MVRKKIQLRENTLPRSTDSYRVNRIVGRIRGGGLCAFYVALYETAAVCLDSDGLLSEVIDCVLQTSGVAILSEAGLSCNLGALFYQNSC